MVHHHWLAILIHDLRHLAVGIIPYAIAILAVGELLPRPEPTLEVWRADCEPLPLCELGRLTVRCLHPCWLALVLLTHGFGLRLRRCGRLCHHLHSHDGLVSPALGGTVAMMPVDEMVGVAIIEDQHRLFAGAGALPPLIVGGAILASAGNVLIYRGDG